MKKIIVLFLIVLSALPVFSSGMSREELEKEIGLIRITNKDEVLNVYAGKTEVTQKLYAEIMNDNPSMYVDPSYPVTNVTELNIILFCNRLSVRMGYTPYYILHDITKYDRSKRADHYPFSYMENTNADGFRLLNFYEWRSIAELDIYVKKEDISWRDGELHPVASKKPNKKGFYDTERNACEIIGTFTWGGNARYYNVMKEYDYRSSRDQQDMISSSMNGFRICRGLGRSTTREEIESCFEEVKLPNKKVIFGKTEVTNCLYDKVFLSKCFNNVYVPISEDDIYNTHLYEKPVTEITWLEAVRFCNELSKLMGLKPCYRIKENAYFDIPDDEEFIKHGKRDENYGCSKIYLDPKVEWDESANGFRLPTDDEWVYAAKADDETYANAEYCNDLNEYEVYSEYHMPGDVASKLPNKFGLYDMGGNVKEWCWDIYKYSSHVIRGHSFKDGSAGIKKDSSSLLGYPDIPSKLIGFRVCRNVAGSPFEPLTKKAEKKPVEIFTVSENLRIRTNEETSSEIITTMTKGTKVKILQKGKEQTIDGIKANWVKIEVMEDSKARDGSTIKKGTSGWCFQGYLVKQ